MTTSATTAGEKPMPKTGEVAIPEPKKSETSYSKKDLVSLPPIEKVKDEKITLSEETITTLADTLVFHYQIYKKMLSATPPVALADFQKNFLKDFDTKYPSTSEAQLPDKFKDYLKDPSRMVFALKLAEWEMATLQMATGLMAEEIAVPTGRFGTNRKTMEELEDVPRAHQVITYGPNGERVVNTQKYTKIDRLIKKVFGTPNEKADIANQDDIKKVRERNAKKQRQLNINLYYQDRTSSSATRMPSPTIDSTSPNLNVVQKAFIQEFFGTAAGPISEEYQVALEQKATELLSTRLDIYTKTGMDAANVQRNFIERKASVAAAPDFTYGTRDLLQRKLLSDLREGTPNISFSTEEQLRRLGTEFTLKITEEAKKAAERKKEEGHSRVIEGHISRLGEKTISEIDRQKAEAFQTEISSLEGQKTKATEAIKTKTEIDRLKTTIGKYDVVPASCSGLIKQINDGINAELGGGVTDGYDRIFGSGLDSVPWLDKQLKKYEIEETKLESKLSKLSNRRDAQQERVIKITEFVSSAAANGQVISSAELDKRIKDINDEIERLDKEILNNTPGSLGLEQQIDKVQKDKNEAQIKKEKLEDIKEKSGIRELIEQYSQLTLELKTKQDSYNSLRVGIDQKYHRAGEITALSLNDATPGNLGIEKEIEIAEKEKAKIEKDEFQEQRKESYETYRDTVMTQTEGIMNRAILVEQTGFALSDIYRVYREVGYPDYYLLVMQIIGGESITSPEPESIKAFARLSKLVSVQYVDTVLYANGVAVPVSPATISLNEITSQRINKLLESFRTEAYNGDLGRITEAEKKLIQDYGPRIPSIYIPAFDTIFDNLKKCSSLYGYRNINELARRIEKARMSGAIVFNPPISYFEELKYLAIEFDKEYKKRFSE